MLINLRKMVIPRFIHKLKKSTKGTILIEFAITFPVTLLLLLGGFETFRLLMAHRKSNMTVTSMSNLVSQNKDLSSAAIQDIFDAVDNIMKPLELDENGQIFISYITGTAGSNIINLQCTGTINSSLASKIGAEGEAADLDRIPGNFSIAEFETVVITEVIYRYEPIFVHFSNMQQSNMFARQNIYQLAVQKPRYGSINFDGGCP